VELTERRILETRPDLGELLHGAGHAIGLGLHEPPFLVPRVETPLAAGMIFTVEPGLYRSGLGGMRLEDDVVVRNGAPEILSTLPLELVELAGSM
jgi:Xaa-Pro dipeptidase